MRLILILAFIVLCAEAATPGGYCPGFQPRTSCLDPGNECCADSHCPFGRPVCCKGPCGNTCRAPVPTRSGGRRVIENDKCCIGSACPWSEGDK